MRDLQKDLASEFDLPIHLIQNMQVSPGSIVVNFDIAQDADFDLDLNLLLEVEETITSNSYNFMFEGVSYRPNPNSFKTVTRSDPNVVDDKQTEEDDEEEIDMLIIAIGAGGGLLVFAFIAIVVTCFYKRKKVPDNLDFFRKEMEGIPNNTLSAKVQEPIHRVRTLPPGYKYNDYEESE
ncbi:uncharacterized protein [Antedon mediterranea]|uniref:uncharacterized protein n=1 Tax=Antedon mediterranea TaxID=105859 RepID=UPI003AF5791E